MARAPSPAYSLPRRRSQGMPQGYSGRKLTLIINVGERRYQPYGLPASVRSIAFSASGAIIVYPALFGCSPSSARSRFSSPLLVHHCVEIIEINQSIGRAVIFQPAIQLQNLVRRPLRKQILRV